MTTAHGRLAERVRAKLADQPTLQETRMFGGLAFMVDDKMVVATRPSGELLVRADPARNAELLARKEASQAEMGAGRSMGASWISVDAEAAGDDTELSYWLSVALEYNARIAKTPRKRPLSKRKN
ncbi:MAG: TfoX/Sxy family protein [Trueperaceae bacterium]|nr:TfoX/Sxy family protein [Trueperaceae bacterium]